MNAGKVDIRPCNRPSGCGHPRSEHKHGDQGSDQPTTCLHGWTPKAKELGITGCPCTRFGVRTGAVR